MHALVRRQLRKVGLDVERPPANQAEWQAFLDRMGLLCTQADQDRYTFERSLMISSRELGDLYDDLKATTEARFAEHVASLALLRATLESTADGILVVSSDGRIVIFNQRFLDVTGIPPEVAERGDLAEFRVHARANAANIGAYDLMLSRNAADPTAETHDLLSMRDGRVLERSTRPQLVAGRVVGSVISLRDVTARLGHEEQLREVNNRVTALVSHLPGGNLVEDEKRRIVQLNQEFCTMFGLPGPPDVWAGRDCREMMSRAREVFADPDRFVAQVDAAIRERRECSREELALLDGRLLERDCFPILVDGVYRGQFWQYRDVTEARRMQVTLQHSERLASVGVLAAGVAHEINNPLAYVVNNLEFLSGLVHGEAAVVVAEARQGAERVRDIVRDLRTFSRAPYERSEPVDLLHVLDSVSRMAANEIRPRARLIRVDGTLPRVFGNESRYAQVFLNLLVNASHAIPEGASEQNQITMRTWTDRTGRAVVEIRDTGRGMGPEVRCRIFDPFFTTSATGMGLGLSICNNIVREAGGEIAVESAPGSGTAFRVYLPPFEGPPLPSVGETPTPPGLAARRSLLLVDDEPLLADSVARLLRSRFRVAVCQSGAEALELLAQQRFDLVLCDLMMPGMSGMDLFAEVQVRDPAMAERMVFVTGGVFTPKAHDFVVGLPPGRLLEKPFEIATLLQIAAAFGPL